MTTRKPGTVTAKAATCDQCEQTILEEGGTRERRTLCRRCWTTPSAVLWREAINRGNHHRRATLRELAKEGKRP